MELLEEFKPTTKAEWLAKIEKDLKGKPVSDLMLDFGEIKMDAFYHFSDRVTDPPAMPFGRGWEIGEDIVVKDDFNKTNKELLAALEAGVNAPRLVLSKNISAKNLAIILDNADLEIISAHFYLTNKNASPQSLLPHLLNYISENKLNEEKIKIGINWADENAVGPQEMNRLLGHLKNTKIQVKSLPVNGLYYFSENSPVKELVDILIKGEGYLQKYISEGFTGNFINQHILFSIGIGKNYFLQIAKMRAFFMLWANIMKAYQIDGEIPQMEAHFAPASLSTDANTNMIAATTQAMSAIIGGASRLTILPSDASAGEGSGFAKRIARNVQHILQMESYFDRVTDPVAGSYFVEKLTAGLAEKAWEVFCKK